MDQTSPLLMKSINDARPCSADHKAMPTNLWTVLFDTPREMNTYAVLDGATILHLPEILANTGMPHECLFQGRALEELGDKGPWVVQLEGGSELAKGLITDANTLTSYWPKARFFIQSDGDLLSITKHLRHFTRIEDTNGKWYLFRFWEADFVTNYLRAMTEKQLRAFFGNGLVNEFIVLGDSPQRLSMNAAVSGGIPTQITLTPAIYQALSHVVEARFRRDAIGALTKDTLRNKDQAFALYHDILALPMQSREAITMLIDCLAPLPAGLTDQRVVAELRKSVGAPDLARAMLLKNGLSMDVSV